MRKTLFIIFFIGTFFLVVYLLKESTPGIFPSTGKPCALDAKLCSDGRSIGRSGPNCDFPACPDVVTAPVSTMTWDVPLSVGKVQEVDSLRIKLNNILKDNRCPIDVVCITAGGVVAEISLAGSNGAETIDLSTSGDPYLFERYYISIASVTPSPKAGKEITNDQYKVVVHIVK